MSLRAVGVDSLIQELESLTAELEGEGEELSGELALVFDGDGTLWTCDVGEDVFEDALERTLIREDAKAQLVSEAEKWQLDSHGSPTELAERLYQAYRRGIYPERDATEMMVWGYAGWTERELRVHAREALNRHGLKTQIYRPIWPIVVWAREARLRTVLISASPQLVVEEAARFLGFASTDISAGRARVEGSSLMAELATPLPYADGKRTAGKALLGDAVWVAAFGDSAFDLEMFQQARLAVAVRPKAELQQRLNELPNVVLLSGEL